MQTQSSLNIKVNRPEPINMEMEAVYYKRRMDPVLAIEALVEGNSVLISDFFSTGLMLLRELKIYLKKNHPDQTFKGQRDFRSVYRELSHRLLVKVSDNKLMVRKAPEIGWFEILYPDIKEFLLPFPQVQGLNSAWQWYEKGLDIPVLDEKIHPFYGTYFPTRFDHLGLFDHWLQHYKGEKQSAIDIGIGCGVLSYQMIKHGFEKVYGTDSNPNAIIGLDINLKKKNLSNRIDIMHGDLFADLKFKTELIVFNPPWLPASYNSEGIDNAVYYNEELFPEFFKEAKKHLKDEGRLVLLFSNLAKITNLEASHPIETELKDGGRFQKEYFVQKKVKMASNKTRRNQNWRGSEMVELWVLKIANDPKSDH